LPRARRGAANPGRRAEHRSERGYELVDARGDACSDVVSAAVLATERREHGLHDVRDVHVVALVAPVAEDRDRLAPLPAANEDGDDATLEVGTLPRAIDVGEAEGDGREIARPDQLLGLGLEAG